MEDHRGLREWSGLNRRRWAIAVAALLSSVALSAIGGAVPKVDTGPFGFNQVETHRIRIRNATGGAVEISPDAGRSWQTVGSVVRPATALAEGFAASRWAQDGTVCATAVHGLRLRVGPSSSSGRGGLLAVVPKEFASPPPNYGGFVAGASGIYTDIAAGTSIFRNLAPFLGNVVLREENGSVQRIGPEYRPLVGDVLVIPVARPERMPRSITLENRSGGKVLADFGDGELYEFARVHNPVEGVGRFDATGFTGVGCINTNHPGVVTVSTAPDHDGKPVFDDPFGETRGGFMIQPARHAEAEASGGGPVAQVMVVEPVSRRFAAGIEGTPPLFQGFLGLQFQSRDPSRSFVCQMRVDDGEWEPLVQYVGIRPGLFTSPRELERALDRQGRGRFVRQGVTAFRILFPEQWP